MFDPTTAQMFLNAQQNYVNAMRQDYMQGVQDMKEYNKMYSDFYSPYAKDNENWDRLVFEPIRNLLNNYGPDLLRSQEGRSRIQQAIMSVPSGSLSQLKASAKTGFDALAAKRELEAKGLYSQQYQDFLDKQAGRASFEDWDTLKDGVYNSTFSPYEELGKVTDYIYKGREPLYKGTKNGSRIYSYDYNDLINAAKSKAQDFINTPRGSFEWHLAQEEAKRQDPNISGEQLIQKSYDILDKRIADANTRYLSGPKYETDPYAMANYEHSLRMKELQDKANYKSGNGSKSSNDGHTHATEQQLSGLSALTNIPVSTISQLSSIEDIKAFTNVVKNSQSRAFSSMFTVKDNKYVQTKTKERILSELSVYDNPSIIAKQFNTNVDNENRISITPNMTDRMYSSLGILNAAYGFRIKKHRTSDLTSSNKFKTDKFVYKVSPTGKHTTLLCKDGKVRTFYQMNVYRASKYEEKKDKDSEKMLKVAISNPDYIKQKNTVWYDSHYTTKTGGVNPYNKDFVLNLGVDDRFINEVESNDVLMGRSLGDKSGRDTSDAMTF